MSSPKQEARKASTLVRNLERDLTYNQNVLANLKERVQEKTSCIKQLRAEIKEAKKDEKAAHAVLAAEEKAKANAPKKRRGRPPKTQQPED